MTQVDKQRIRLAEAEWNDPLAFSQAVRVGGQLWIAGQVAVDADGASVGIGDPAVQAERIWDNLERVLAAAGTDLDALVATTTYIVDRAYRDAATRVRARRLDGRTYPTNTLVIVAGLGRPEFLIEVSAVAVLPCA